MHRRARRCLVPLVASLWLGIGVASAASNKVYRCTGANGKVTLSDRRCPDDDAASQQAEAARSAGGQASAAAESRACLDARERLAERRRQEPAGETARKTLKQLEDSQRRACGA